MRSTLKQLWASIARLLSMFDRATNTIDVVLEMAEDAAITARDEMRIENEAALKLALKAAKK